MRKKAPLCKGSWPVGPEGLSYPLHETRRNPLVKTECNIANGLRHCRPWAGGGTPSTGCICIRGKQQKRRWRKFISIHAFFLFSLCPWCCFSSPKLSCESHFIRYDCMSHSGSRGNAPGGSRGDTPGAGYRGRIGPCFSCSKVKQRSWKNRPFSARPHSAACKRQR